MKTDATSTHDLQDCRPIDLSSLSVPGLSRGFACRAKVRDWQNGGAVVTGPIIGWQVGGEGGGCSDANGKPVFVNDWANIQPDGNQCTHTQIGSSGFYNDSCTYTNVDPDGSGPASATSFTCRHIGGQFQDSSGSPNLSSVLTFASPAYFLGQPETLVAQGQACKGISNRLMALQCYAENYYSAGGGDVGCGREWHFDWSATDAAKFVIPDYRGKPKANFLTDVASYSADGQSASVNNEENETIMVQTGESSQTACTMARLTQLSFKKISDTKLLVDLTQSGRITNTTDAACAALAQRVAKGEWEQNGGGPNLTNELKKQQFLFYMTK
jgi:hypothetical protein